MGKVRVNWTQEAESWLLEIHNYIAQDNPAAAFRTVQGIYRKAEVLEEFPEIGYVYRKHEALPIRILLYGHYRIAYLIKSADEIDVLGVFHGALDIDRYLT
jgi:plasmid stabilization system protein ParE